MKDYAKNVIRWNAKGDKSWTKNLSEWMFKPIYVDPPFFRKTVWPYTENLALSEEKVDQKIFEESFDEQFERQLFVSPPGDKIVPAALNLGTAGHNAIEGLLIGKPSKEDEKILTTYCPWRLIQIHKIVDYIHNQYINFVIRTEVTLTVDGYTGIADVIMVDNKERPSKVLIFDWKFTKELENDQNVSLHTYKDNHGYFVNNRITKLYREYHRGKGKERSGFFNNQWYKVLVQLNFYAWLYRKQNSYDGSIELYYGNINDSAKAFVQRMPLFDPQFFDYIVKEYKNEIKS
jgi:hypothetical protein